MMTDEEFQDALRIRLLRLHDANADAAEEVVRKARAEADNAELILASNRSILAEQRGKNLS